MNFIKSHGESPAQDNSQKIIPEKKEEPARPQKEIQKEREELKPLVPPVQVIEDFW
jgi:hypothetical protein